jgi:hypothetical protein
MPGGAIAVAIDTALGVPIDSAIMTKADAIAFYGNQKALADVLGVKQPSVAGWGEYPPEIQQVRLERLTGGRLKAEPSCYAPKAAA